VEVKLKRTLLAPQKVAVDALVEVVPLDLQGAG
jgi:hypothetical protein